MESLDTRYRLAIGKNIAGAFTFPTSLSLHNKIFQISDRVHKWHMHNYDGIKTHIHLLVHCKI